METLAYINSLNCKDLNFIKTCLYKNGILANYSKDGRMVLYASKNNRFILNTPMSAECNGLVIDVNNSKILAMPPSRFISNVDSNIVAPHLSNNIYDIYLVEDGTVISMYYWEPLKKWVISTTRSHDNTNAKWGDYTYSEVINDLLGPNAVDFYNSLDKNTSYTFGIKHASMHPFREGGPDPINKIWFIQSYNGTVSYTFDNSFGINPQIKVRYPNNLQTIFANLKYSLPDYMNNGSVLYGYILRSNNPLKTGYYSNIILESSLLQKIRHMCYNSIINNTATAKAYNRELYMIISAFLNINVRALFIELFPHYIEQYDAIATAIESLISDTIGYVDNPSSLCESDENYENVKNIYNSISTLEPLNTNNRAMISLEICNVKYSDVIYKMLSD